MAQLEIPNRSLFRQPEVCEIASIQPYVLRSWEAEFPDLGVAKAEGGARVYRRADVERVLRIKQLLYGEGLTLAGVRRKLTEERPAGASDRSGAGEYRRAVRQATRASASCTSSAACARLSAMLSRAPGRRRRRATEIFSCRWTRRRSAKPKSEGAGGERKKKR